MGKEELKVAGMKLMIEGGAQFTADLNTAKTTSKMLTSELKLLEAGTTSAGKNGIEFLRTKSEALTSKLAQQEAQTKITKIALQEAGTAAEVDAKQVQRLEDAVTKSRIEEEKLKVQLLDVNAAMDKATNSALQHGIAQKEMGEKAKAAGEKISGVGDNMTKFVTVPVLAAAAALAALAVKTIASADAIQLASDKYGLSTERIQELTYAGKGLDVEMDVITGSQSKLIKAMQAAKDGTEKQTLAFRELGISTTDSDGKLRDSNVVFGEVIDALSKIPNETEASSLAMILLGKSAMDMNPLIRAGSGELARLSEEAHKNGAVMSGESVAALDEFGDSIEKAKVSIGTAAGEITVKMLPTLNKLLPIVQKDIVPAIGAFAEGVGDLIVGFNNLDPITKGVVTTLAGIIVVAGPALKMVGTGITFIGTMNTALGAHKIAMATAAVATDGLAASEGVATVAGAGMMATLGPIAIAIAAVAVTYAAVGILAANTMTDAAKETKALLDETKSLATSCDDSATAFKNQSAEIGTNAAATQKMSDKLFALSDKEKKSNTEKAQMTSLVSQLNEQMPELNLTIDEQTGALNQNKASVDAWIKSEKDKLKLQANEEYLTQLYREQIDVSNQMETAQEALTKATAEDNKTNAGALGFLYSRSDALINAQDAVDVLTVAQEKNTASLKIQEDAIGQSGAALIPYTDSILGTGAVVVETNEKIVASAELTAEETAAALKKQEDDLKANEDAIKQYYDDLQQSLKDHLAEMGGLEDEGIKRSELTAAKLKENRDQQVKDYQDWREGLKVVAELIPGDVLAELEKLGPEYDQIIDDLANMSPKEIAAWVESWRAPAAEAAKAASDEMGKAPEAVAGAIINMTAEFQKTALLESAAREAGRKATQAYIDGSNSVSTTGSRAGMPSYIPRYADGTRYVPYDQIALIHKGEAVIPADENPYNAAVSLGGIATNRAMANYGSSSSVVNNSPVTSSTNVSLSVANLIVREEADIDKISTQLAAKVAASRKSVGS